MASYREPAIPTPALDFCQIIGAKQRNPGGTAALAVPLDDSEQVTLNQLLADCVTRGATADLEARARRFLLVYREREDHSRVLTGEERAQLNDILSNTGGSRRPHLSQRRSTSLRWSWTRARVALVVVFALIVLIPSGVALYHWANPPAQAPAGTAQQNPPAQQVPPGTTDLQNLRQDWGPWQQLTPSDQRPQTGQPAVLLLQNGGYYASMRWFIPASSAAWQADLGGNVTNVDVRGNYADITDADGNPYIVGINRAFVVSSNPETVLKIDPTGNVLSMTLAVATAIRHHINHK